MTITRGSTAPKGGGQKYKTVNALLNVFLVTEVNTYSASVDFPLPGNPRIKISSL